MVLPSIIKEFKSPLSQSFNLRCRCEICSFVLDLALGLCNVRAGKIIAVFIATDSSAEQSPKARNKRVISLTKSFPTLPDGSLNKFFLQ